MARAGPTHRADGKTTLDIAIHLGAHCTDEDRIQRVLTDNRARLRRQGIVVPPPGRARPALRRALQARAAGRGGDEDVLDELLDGASATPARLVLSYEAFLGVYANVLAGDRMYPEAGARARLLADLFPGHAVGFHFGLRNQASFVPALFEASSVQRFGTFLEGQDLARMRWTDPVAAIRAACPDVPLTVWCTEDLALIWPEVLRRLAGTDGPLQGEDAILAEIMTEGGFRRLQAYLRDNPIRTQGTWRKVVAAFLRKYARPERLEREIDLPGWTQGIIAGLTEHYAADVAAIRARDDVTVLGP